MTFSGWIATLAGWLVTEIGRQPYLVYGVMTTAEAASSVPAGSIAITFIGYSIVYTLLLLSYLVVLTQLARAAAGDIRVAPPSGEMQPTGTVA
jgi:cytochrome d ubiquinol oxidase subunit I